MMRSMFAGVSGLKNHQTRLDVIGNNIANVNTIGFKASRVNFQDILSQTMRGASSADGQRGGSNPMQIGLGMTVASIDTLQTQGNLQSTGKMTDLAIQGNGFFIVSDGNGQYYTRAGNFDLDSNGNLVNPANGMKLMGYKANDDGTFSTELAPINVYEGSNGQLSPKATTDIGFERNLDAGAALNTVYPTSIVVYDSLGAPHTVDIEFAKTAVGTWSWTAKSASGGTLGGTTTGTLTFDANGKIQTISPAPPFTLDITPTNGASNIQLAVDFSNITQYAAPSTVQPAAQSGDKGGYQKGDIQSFTIDQTGVVMGSYTNGYRKALGKIAIADFRNPGGLLKEADNLYSTSNNSGDPLIGNAGENGRGKIAPGTLEMSNVDLSQEFTNMIVTQRGFQANSRIITTSDEMLQELVNLKR